MTKEAQLVWPFSGIILEASARHGIEPELIAAIIVQESSGNPYAVRPETEGFWKRYGKRVIENFKRTKSRRDDHWAKYPDLCSASWGLMQPLYVTAREMGFDPQYPSELCEPALNIDVGCTIFKAKLKAANGSIPGALLRYNGGSRLSYPDEVLKKRDAIRSSGLFSQTGGTT